MIIAKLGGLIALKICKKLAYDCLYLDELTIYGKDSDLDNMRTQWIPRGEMQHVLAALTPPNRLAAEVSMATGLRISDVLSLKPVKLEKARCTVTELKTGKTRPVYWPLDLLERMRAVAGKNFVFEGRCSGLKHRTRQAVYKDIKRAAAAFRLPENIAPHSLRKIYAVDLYHRTKNMDKVRRLLNHSSEPVTMLYALADQLDKRKAGRL